MRTVVVGASSGLGRCIGVGLSKRGHDIALLARRLERLEDAAAETGGAAVPIACDVVDADSCHEAVTAAARELGGIDSVVYTPAVSPLHYLTDTDVDTWRHVLDTNVVGASLFTTAALPHLAESRGRAVYLSSVSASGPPWPGLGAYAVSKAALEKLVDAWSAEHPEMSFTRLVVGECAGGEGDSMTSLASNWDLDLAGELVPTWLERQYMTGAMIDVEDLVDSVEAIIRTGGSIRMPTVEVTPRPSPGGGDVLPEMPTE